MEVQEYTSRYEFKKKKKIIGIAYRQYHTNLTKVHLLFPKWLWYANYQLKESNEVTYKTDI